MPEYEGQTYRIPCNRGGWVPNPNVDLIPPEGMVESVNINLHNGGRETRGGTTKVNGSAISGTPQITGGFQYRKEDGTEFIITGTDDGDIYADYTTQIATGLTASKKFNFLVFNDHLYAFNGADVPQKWDGVATTTFPIGGAPAPPACTAALAGAGAGNVDDGTHSYKVTYVTAEGETDAGDVSNVITVSDHTTNGQVNLTGIPVATTAVVTSRKIYRTVAGDTGDYLLLTTIANNTATTYTDNTADSGLGAAAPTSNGTARIPADWTGSSYPKDAIVHGRGASEEIWAYGAPSNLKDLYASDTATDDFTDANVTKITINTGDGFGVVALEEYSDQLVAIGKTRPYIVDDADADRANWGYGPAQWEGGVAHETLLVRTQNDLIAMDEAGEIYSVIKAQSSGDFQTASISRPAFIHKWIADNVDLAQISEFHMVYDRELRAIKIFIVRKNQTVPDTVLVFFVDRPAEEAWTLHRYYQTNYVACSFPVRVSAGVWKIYTGGQAGFVWQLESSTISDNGNFYYNGFTTPDLNFDNPRIEKLFDAEWAIIKLNSAEEIMANVFIDGIAITGGFNIVDENGNLVIDENGNFIVGGNADPFTFTLDSTQTILQNTSHPIGRTGTRIKSEIYNEAEGEKMFVSQLMYDFQPLGAQPA